MLFKIKATTAFMKGKLGGIKNEWRVTEGQEGAIAGDADERRDIKQGEPVILVESTDGKDWRWVAERNLIPLENENAGTN